MGDDFVDHYAVLGLSELAKDGPPGREVVSKAFRKLALRFHPDKVQSQGLSEQAQTQAKARFEAISLANEVLQDDEKRAAFEKEYEKRREHERRQRALDEESRKLRAELEQREKAAAAEKRKAQELGSSSFSRTAKHFIRERDAAFKKRLYSKLFSAENSTPDTGNRKQVRKSEKGVELSKEEEFFRTLFESKRDQVLDAVNSHLVK